MTQRATSILAERHYSASPNDDVTYAAPQSRILAAKLQAQIDAGADFRRNG